MRVTERAPLAGLTTLRTGGPARRLVVAETVDEVEQAVRAVDTDPAAGPLLLLGGGSNVVLPDDGWDGTVVLVASRGVRTDERDDGEVDVVVEAGEPWDDLVARTVADGLAGLEPLSGIPGSTGATPVQNVGAYGVETSDVLREVEVYDRVDQSRRVLPAEDLGLGYRTSALKGHDRLVVLRVTFTLRRDALSGPVRYAQLASALGVEMGDRAPVTAVRDAVLALRASKGMVVDPEDPDTRSTGSFFTNPVLDDDALAALLRRVHARCGQDAEPPQFPDVHGRRKVSAAWLVEHAGFRRGHGDGPARVSGKHTLAITNASGYAATADVLRVAREVRDGVREAFGVELEPEPLLVGVAL